MSGAEYLIETRNLRCSLQGNEILRGVDLRLGEGEVLGLIGPNGAGKSTLLKALMGYYPSEGSITLSGTPLGNLSGEGRAQLLSYVSQQGPDQLSFSALEVVEMGAYGQGGLFGRSRYDDCEQALRSLEYVGMGAFADRDFSTLSGGERQLVLFARVLLQDAPVLLLDEPTANLDIGHEQAVLEMVDELRGEGKSTVIAIHNLNLAAEYCDRLILLEAGRVKESGPPEDVLTPENIRDAYGREVHIDRNQASGSLTVTPIRKFPAGGAKRIHIIGGAGSGVNLTRLLLRQGYEVSGGVAHRLDSDARLWQSLSIESVVVDAFDEIDDASYARAADLAGRADYVILAAFPVGSGNRRNLELAASFADRLIILDDHTRSFYGDGLQSLFESIRPWGRVFRSSEVLDLLGGVSPKGG